MSDSYGIEFFRDRSDERPVATFSPINSTISVSWNYSRTQSGIRATFNNELLDYEEDELQIPNPVYSFAQGYDVVKYDSIANPDLVRRRAVFDALQDYYQGRRSITIESSIEASLCERGDLISVVTDVLNDASHGARIREVLDEVTIRISQDIPAVGTQNMFAEDNVFNLDDVFRVGAQSVCMIQTPGGTVMRTIEAIDGDIIRLAEVAGPDDGDMRVSDAVQGAHIAIGPLGDFTFRCIVMAVDRTSEERATLTVIDEAPEIYQKMQEMFG